MSKSMKKKLLKVFITLLIVASIATFCTVYFRNNVVQTIMDSSIAQVRAIATNSVNVAASSVLNDGISYDELFEIEKDKDGKITMIKANSPKINKIAREIANLAQANLDALGTQELGIAAGTFTGIALLTGLGPDITIKIVPIGTANCDFVSYLQPAGINQTLHKIYIDVYADIDIITPLDDPTVQVKAEILVCENLIIGDVPNTFLDMQNGNGLLNLG